MIDTRNLRSPGFGCVACGHGHEPGSACLFCRCAFDDQIGCPSNCSVWAVSDIRDMADGEEREVEVRCVTCGRQGRAAFTRDDSGRNAPFELLDIGTLWMVGNSIYTLIEANRTAKAVKAYAERSKETR